MGIFNIFKRKNKIDDLYENKDGFIRRKNNVAENNWDNWDDYNATDEENFCMIIEDIFTITGRGTIVTGRIQKGQINSSDKVWIKRDEQIIKQVQIGGIESFRKMIDYAKIGDNVGILLRDVTKSDLSIGDKLVK